MQLQQWRNKTKRFGKSSALQKCVWHSAHAQLNYKLTMSQFIIKYLPPVKDGQKGRTVYLNDEVYDLAEEDDRYECLTKIWSLLKGRNLVGLVEARESEDLSIGDLAPKKKASTRKGKGK